MSDLIERQAAIDALKEEEYPCESDYDKGYMSALKKSVWIMEKWLPSAQPEQTDCEYCHEDSDGYVTPIEKNFHAFISFGMNGCELSLKAKGWHRSAKIKYCPMCGRELKT